MNEERTGKYLQQVEHIRGHLWHRYSITVDQVLWRPWNFLSDDFNLTRITLSNVAYLLAATLYQGNIDRNHKLCNIVSTDLYLHHMEMLLEYCYI